MLGSAFGVSFALAFRIVFPMPAWLIVAIVVGILSGVTFKLIGLRLSRRQISTLYHIQVFEKTNWSWKNALWGMAIGLLAGFSFGGIIGWTIWKPIILDFGFSFGIAGDSWAYASS